VNPAAGPSLDGITDGITDGDPTMIDPGSQEVAELLERRDQIQGWLRRLEDHGATVSQRVRDRVRSDYEQRLRDTLVALSAHREALHQELAAATDAMAAARATHARAADQLEEETLRKEIGELSAKEWQIRQTRLDEEVRAAAREETDARDRVAQLRELLEQLDGPEPQPPAGETPASESVGGGQTRGGDAHPAPGPLPAEAAAAGAGDAFLAEIDRALTADADDHQPLAPPDPDRENGEDTAPKPGIKCAECGYTNDLSAWFCGVCGADVA
jgi:hypothetical protein